MSKYGIHHHARICSFQTWKDYMIAYKQYELQISNTYNQYWFIRYNVNINPPYLLIYKTWLVMYLSIQGFGHEAILN